MNDGENVQRSVFVPFSTSSVSIPFACNANKVSFHEKSAFSSMSLTDFFLGILVPYDASQSLLASSFMLAK